MSSRNQRLTENERQQAPKLYEAMLQLQSNYQQGQRDVKELTQSFKQSIEGSGIDIQYAEIRSVDSLELIEDRIEKEAIFAVAGFSW